MPLGRALRCVVWNALRDDAAMFDNARAANGRFRELRVEVDKPARTVGMSALCAVVSDMVGDNLTSAVGLALVVGLFWWFGADL
jgi:hypothetical protein